ncbi:MAG: GTPase HflX [Candidatus Puniceispirillales bacterium]
MAIFAAMGQETAFVIHPDNRLEPLPRPAEQCLEEASGLAEAIGLEVIMADIAPLNRPRAATFIGAGYADMLKQKAEEDGHDPVIIINTALAPVQQRNLEMITGCKVIDRTALILEIFGARASSHAGRLQVELAALSFQRSRLVRSWTHLERQRGGGGFMGGPGERQIELDRRMLMQRVSQIKMELKDVERTRHLQRANRDRAETPTVVLVGYTNAGKSTLFNALTGAGVLSKDMLFATLDPTMRQVTLTSGRKIILADTVGFISQLPTELVEAFKSTLEEVLYADLLLHVHDASSPLAREEEGDVDAVLGDLGLDEMALKTRRLHVYNKIDAVADSEGLAAADAPGVRTSATTGEGIDHLISKIEDFFSTYEKTIEISLSPSEGAVRAWLFENGRVHSQATADDGVSMLEVTLSAADHDRLLARWPQLTERLSRAG